jgi:hypothetical protein
VIAFVFQSCAVVKHAWVDRPVGKSFRFSMDRHQRKTALEAEAGNHLVIVRYGPEHNFEQEWVFNDADIDGARIVWARDLGDDQNQNLLHYFSDRQVWLLEVDKKTSRISRIPLLHKE